MGMKACCLASASRYLKKNRDVAVCDRCGFLLMAYTDRRDIEETLSRLRSWGGEFAVAELKGMKVVAKSRSPRKGS